jgi:hypothetical protein
VAGEFLLDLLDRVGALRGDLAFALGVVMARRNDGSFDAVKAASYGWLMRCMRQELTNSARSGQDMSMVRAHLNTIRDPDAVLAERGVISLSPKAAQGFSDALAQPPAVNERLAVALGCPRGFRWVD